MTVVSESTVKPGSSARPGERIDTPLLLMLGFLASVSPFGIDLYLSAFPQMASELHASTTLIQLTLTMFLVGLGVGQLGFGPVSDRIGRRVPLLVGAALFVVASVAAATAPSIDVLLIARLVQGVGAAAGMVIGRAVIADRTTGQAAGRALSIMMLVGNLAPVIAPFVGGVLVDRIGWRGVLLVLTGLAVAMLIGSATLVGESLPRERRSVGGRTAGGVRELGHRGYLAPAAVFVLAFGVMMAYISASPFLYQKLIGVGAVTYGLLFALNGLGLVAGSALSSRRLRIAQPHDVLAPGVAVLLVSALTLLALALLQVPSMWLPVPIFVAVTSVGYLFGPATGAALDAIPHAVGSGSAVIGAAQFGLAAAVSPLVGLGGDHSALGLAVVIAVLATLAALVCRRPGPSADRAGRNSATTSTTDDAPRH